jgi:hypothetical protein
MRKIKLNSLFIYLSILILTFSCVKDDDFVRDENSTFVVSEKFKESNNYKVSSQEAETYALNFLYTHFKNKSNTSIEKINDFTLPVAEKKLYLIEVSPKGFILLSDDKRNIPVLAFSETDDFLCKSFDELPNGAKEWISETLLLNHEIETDLKSLRDNDVLSQWGLYLSDAILSTKWYNHKNIL